MKKILIISSALIGLVITSCRQNDDILSSEDVATLQIIQKHNNNPGNININQSGSVTSTPNPNAQTTFAEVIPPPKR